MTCRKIAKVHTNNCKNMIFKILQKVIEDCVYVDKLLLVVMIDDADTCFIELAFKRFPWLHGRALKLCKILMY